MTIENISKLCFTFFIVIQYCKHVQCEKQVLLEHDLSKFWTSIDEMVLKQTLENGQIAQNISKVSFALNQTNSGCFQAIEHIFQSGLQNEWSAKCKYIFEKFVFYWK